MRCPSRVSNWLVLLLLLIVTNVTAQDYCTEFVNRGDLIISQTVRAAVEEGLFTFQELVDCLQDQDSLTFEISSLTLETLRISNPITIRGTPEASTSLACLDGPIFIINADGVNINNLEISGCRLDSADAPVVLRSGSTLELNSVNFTNNRNRVGSASLRMGRGSTLVINKCSFYRNNGTEANVLATNPGCEVTIRRSNFRRNKGEGSTLSIADSNRLNISHSHFTNNQASQGGGVIRIESLEERSSVVIDDASEFRNNEAVTGEGGAIIAIGSVSLVIREGTMFTGNQAANQGGALFIMGAATVRIEDAYFIENASLFLGGGAIFAENSTFGELEIEISNTLFSGNAARNQLGSGGAIRLQGTGVHCVLDRGVSFTSNHAELDGGAVHISNVLLMIVRESSFIGNEAHQGGAAALYVVSTMNVNFDIMVMNVSIESCLFLFNKAVTTVRGGGTLGFVGARTEVVITESRFHENECPTGSGAAVYIFEGPVITISNSSFAHNRAIWGAGIYAEMDCKCDISNSIFFGNNAEEGGAISTRDNVDLDVIDSQFINNSAKEDGGAVRSEHHALSRGSDSLFTFTNCEFENNNAGYDISVNAVHSTSTRGGGILVIGRGQYVRIIGNTFRNNSASEGGGIAAISPRQFTLTEQTRFEANVANFGGGIFTIVDNSVDIVGEQYLLDGVEFVNNTANSDGGGIRVSSFNSNNDLFAFNAAARTVSIRNTVFRRNRVTRVGGGLAANGVGLMFQNTSFLNNSAISASRTSSGQGGALALTDGSSARVELSILSQNQASDSGGGVFVKDSSLFVSSSNFSSNSVNGVDGKGGAVALELTSDRLISTLEGGERQRNILLECNDCYFLNNSAPLQGGALYHCHSNPNANYTETYNCENSQAVQLGSYEGVEVYNFTCVWIERARHGLENRIIRLARVQFSGNEAFIGAALFTNHPAMINITNGSEASDGDVFLEALQGRTVLSEAGIIFTNNSVSEGGYGKDYATFPKHARMITRTDINGTTLLTRSNVRLGDFLRFNVGFWDAFDQRVTRFDSLTARFQLDEEESGNLSLPLSDQTVGQTGNDGIIRFTGTRLQGNISTAYKLSLCFHYGEEELVMNESLRIDVTIRSCRIGQALNTEQDSRRCEDCGTGEFNANPMKSPCQACGDHKGRKCFGIVAIPEDHYWHLSSREIKVYKCIGREACEFKDRFKVINVTEFLAHLNNINVSHEYNNSYQCAAGYHGILCGSCRPGYGREGESCRKCASKGVIYLLLSMMILWSFGFVGYFIRSILQVASRIEFNKTFGELSTFLPSKDGPRKHRVSYDSPQTGASVSGPSSSEAQPCQRDDLFVDVSSGPRRLNTDAMDEQTLFISPTVRPTQRDLARAVASEISRQRSSCGSGRPAGSASSLRFYRNRKQKTPPANLQQLKNNPSQQTIQSLPLANPFSEVLKVLINFLQVTSVAVTINLEWSEAVRAALLSIGSAANLGTGSGFLSLDCFLESGSLHKSLKRMVLTTLFPAALLLLFVFLWGIYTLTKKRTLKYFLQRSWVTFLAITYFFYINITKSLLRFFACVKIEEDDVGESEDVKTNSTLSGYYWEEDTAVQCYKEKHGLIVGLLVVPLLFAVTIGFPVGTIVILHFKVEHLDDADVVGTYGFLYQAYSHHYWEVLIMLRKASIATVVVFVYSLGANMQGLLCVLVLVVCLSLHLSFVPFREEIHRLNYLETCSLSASIAVFVSGLMFRDSATSKELEIFLSIFAILCVVGTLLLIVLNLILSGEEFLDMKLLEYQIMDRDDLLNYGLSTKSWGLLSHYVSAIKNHFYRRIKGVSFNENQNQSMETAIQMAESSAKQSV